MVHVTKVRNKRLLHEMAAFQREPHSAFLIFSSESHMDFWKILMVGPTNTSYEGGVFSFYAEFPNNYPETPPTVCFVSPIYCCSIISIGRICHIIFDMKSTSELNNYIHIKPCVLSTITVWKGYWQNSTSPTEIKYNQKDREKEILESSTLPKCLMQSHLICPLTKQLFCRHSPDNI